MNSPTGSGGADRAAWASSQADGSVRVPSAAGQGDVGQEGAALRLHACRQTGPVDLLVQRIERLARDCPGEQHAMAALVEQADAVETDFDAATSGSSRARRRYPRPCGRSTSPMKRRVRCSCSSRCQAQPGGPPAIASRQWRRGWLGGPKRDEQAVHGLRR